MRNARLMTTVLMISLFVLISNVFPVMVMSWVPAYNVPGCQSTLNATWGGWGMKDGLSHLALQFWGPTSGGGIKYVTHESHVPTDADVSWFRSWCTTNKVKAMLCIYNNDGSWDWPLVQGIIGSSSNRTSLVTSIVNEMTRLNLDGVDVDFEGTGSYDGDKDNFMLFINALATEVHNKGKVITVTTFAYIWNAPNSNWWASIMASCDGVTSMGYEQIGRNGADWQGYATQKSLASVPAKLLLGMPGYMDSWLGNTATEQLDWVGSDKVVGVGIWDASLAAGSWQSGSVWQRLNTIRGAVAVVKTFTLTASAGTGGTISPTGSVSVDSGKSQTFAIAAQTGYAIDSIIVDGVSKAPAATYTFSSVAMGHSIAARFKMTTAIAGGDFAKANPAGPGISLNGREIILSVPGRGIWNVSIISLTGQEIPVLRPQAMAAGVHTVMLPRLVVRGCYIAKLSCGDRVFTKAVYLEE